MYLWSPTNVFYAPNPRLAEALGVGHHPQNWGVYIINTPLYVHFDLQWMMNIHGQGEGYEYLWAPL